MIENLCKKGDIFFSVPTEVMRVPPEVVDLTVHGCVGHGFFNATKLEGLENSETS